LTASTGLSATEESKRASGDDGIDLETWEILLRGEQTGDVHRDDTGEKAAEYPA
jgi:hypothetical protein